MALDSTLETFTFAGSDDVDGFASSEKARIKGLSQFQPFRRDAGLQTNLAQDLERSNFGSRTALAVLLYSQKFRRLPVRLFIGLLLRGFLAMFLLIFLQALALSFQ